MIEMVCHDWVWQKLKWKINFYLQSVNKDAIFNATFYISLPFALALAF